jgi:hypothetical protein
LWYLQCCSFCSVLPWLFAVFCVSISVMNVIGILMGIVLNMYSSFGSVAIFTMLILPIPEHGRSFCLLYEHGEICQPLISFFSGL